MKGICESLAGRVAIVGLVIEQADTLYPVEFKKTATPSRTASRHFSALKKLDKKVGHEAVICFVENDIPLSSTVFRHSHPLPLTSPDPLPSLFRHPKRSGSNDFFE